MFSPFLSRFSRALQGEWGLLARPRGAFCGGAKKQQLRVVSSCFLVGPQTRRVPLDGKAEPRRAASAQASFPSRRAREEKVARKGRVTESDASGKAAAFGFAEAQGSLDFSGRVVQGCFIAHEWVLAECFWAKDRD